MQLPGEFSPFIEKSGFLLSGRGGYPPPYTLSGPTIKKKLFLCVSSLGQTEGQTQGWAE